MFYSLSSHSQCVHMECVLCYVPPWLWADMSHPASITISESGIHERRGIIRQLFRLTPPGPWDHGGRGSPSSIFSASEQWHFSLSGVAQQLKATWDAVPVISSLLPGVEDQWLKLSGRCGHIEPVWWQNVAYAVFQKTCLHSRDGRHSLEQKNKCLPCVIMQSNKMSHVPAAEWYLNTESHLCVRWKRFSYRLKSSSQSHQCDGAQAHRTQSGIISDIRCSPSISRSEMLSASAIKAFLNAVERLFKLLRQPLIRPPLSCNEYGGHGRFSLWAKKREGANWKQPLALAWRQAVRTHTCVWSSVGDVRHQHCGVVFPQSPNKNAILPTHVCWWFYSCYLYVIININVVLCLI